MTETRVSAFFELAGIPITKMYRLENAYWPDHPDYAERRALNPWWLVMTPYGPIKIGYRKRVISINWEDTPTRVIVTEDNVTKEETLVHAWGTMKCLEYLIALSNALRQVMEAKAE